MYRRVPIISGNCRPPTGGYETNAHQKKKAQINKDLDLLYRRADLNCRPSGYESDALTS